MDSSVFHIVVLSILIGSQISTILTDQNVGSNVTLESGQDSMINQGFHRVACGSTATNLTHVTVKNPQHPESTYSKAICEAIIERVDPSINELNIRFKQLELYRPTFDGLCLHDRFAIYTDLNAVVGPVLCGNQTDLDHDRTWCIEIEQRR